MSIYKEETFNDMFLRSSRTTFKLSLKRHLKHLFQILTYINFDNIFTIFRLISFFLFFYTCLMQPFYFVQRSHYTLFALLLFLYLAKEWTGLRYYRVIERWSNDARNWQYKFRYAIALSERNVCMYIIHTYVSIPIRCIVTEYFCHGRNYLDININ